VVNPILGVVAGYPIYVFPILLNVGLAAGLGVHLGGYLALRHMRPPAPYLPAPVLG